MSVKTFFPFVLSLCIIFLLSRAVYAQNNASPAIFRIIASECSFDPSSRTQTGFGISQENVQGIVTALHGVADCQMIRAENDNGLKVANLQIDKIDIDRDGCATFWLRIRNFNA